MRLFSISPGYLPSGVVGLECAFGIRAGALAEGVRLIVKRMKREAA